MLKDNINDLLSFLVVAQECSFTKAAAKLGVSQSALSHSIRGLEERLNLRLLNRTTRSVSLTEAGSRLQQTLSPRIDEIEDELHHLSEAHNGASGSIRITTSEYAAHNVLWPVLEKFLIQYPDINVEVNIENSLTDIVAERYDAGIRLGEQVAKDMVAARISPDLRMAVIGTPAYFANRNIPMTPEDLHQHKGIRLRPAATRGIYAWEFEKESRKINVRIDGQVIFNTTVQCINAALAGLGLAYVPENLIKEHIKQGRLIQVLEDWCPVFTGFHLYYPSRKQHTKAFALLLDALRYRNS